jgi:hypothetical protein
MKFKRCSVDSLVFGAPIIKTKRDDEEASGYPFHPLKKLLVGKLPAIPSVPLIPPRAARQSSDGLECSRRIQGGCLAESDFTRMF